MYLKSTFNYELSYSSQSSEEILEIYSDAYYAGDPKTRKSRASVLSQNDGGSFSWTSVKQKRAVLSTTEVNYVTACEGTKVTIWLQHLLKDITFLKAETLTLYVNNISSNKLVKTRLL